MIILLYIKLVKKFDNIEYFVLFNHTKIRTTIKMSASKPNIGTMFNNVTEQGEKHYIYTNKYGFLPNDIIEMDRVWKNNFSCDTGMCDCMDYLDYSIWWASKIEESYEIFKLSKNI